MASSTPIIPPALTPQEQADQAGMVGWTRYIGFRTKFSRQVWACTKNGVTLLRPRRDLSRSASGVFEWGENSEGNILVAFAILAHWSGRDEFALRYHQAFSPHLTLTLQQDSWELTTREITQVVAHLQKQAK